VHKIDPAVGPVCRSALSTLARRGGFQLAVLFAALVGTTLPGLAQEGTVKAQHGDWQVVCRPPPPGAKNEICALVQSVTAEDRNNIGLTVYFQKFSDAYKRIRIAFIEGARKRPQEFEKRLRHFIQMTEKNKMFGFGGIEKHY